MKANQENKRNSPSFGRGQFILRAIVVFTICINVGFAGITRTGGRIQAFASIFVNDREFDLDAAVITIDDQVAVQADLKLGQIVLITGDADEVFPVGTADQVIVEDIVEGPIESIDLINDTLVVLGQTVLTESDPVFAILSGINELAGLNVDDVVEIYGFIGNDGDILATRVEQIALAAPFEVTGVVSNVTASTFSINALVVNFSDVSLGTFPGNTIMAGDFVEAKGTTIEPNGELRATTVELKVDVLGAPVEGELGEYEGLITDFVSASSFTVARVSVTTNAQTIFVGGGPGNLTDNVSVKIEGLFDANGLLVADRVIIRGTRIQMEGLVDSVGASSLTILGISISVDSATRLRDKSSADLDPFMLSNLSAGDYVDLRSYKNPPSGNPVLAERVEREDPDSDTELQGFVNSVGAQKFQVHGTTIEVTSQTDFSDANDAAISSAEFFAVLTPGTFVSVEGTEISSTVIVVDSIELELDD